MITLIFHTPFRYLALGKYSPPYVDIFPAIKIQAHLCYLLPLRCLIEGSMTEYVADKSEQIRHLK